MKKLCYILNIILLILLQITYSIQTDANKELINEDNTSSTSGNDIANSIGTDFKKSESNEEIVIDSSKYLNKSIETKITYFRYIIELGYFTKLMQRKDLTNEDIDLIYLLSYNNIAKIQKIEHQKNMELYNEFIKQDHYDNIDDFIKNKNKQSDI